MRVAFYKLGLQNPNVKKIFGSMYQSFFDALNQLPGFTAELVFDRLQLRQYDLVVLPMGDGQEADSLRALQTFGGPAILYVPPASVWFKKKLLHRWSSRIIFAYGTDVSGRTQSCYQDIGIPFLHLPLASDPSVFKPLRLAKKWDVLFIGNRTSGRGRGEFISKLVTTALERGWQLKLLGTGWEEFGFPPKLVSHGPALNRLYNQTKVCVNISNLEQLQGKNRCLDANNRLFDVALAGACQVSNGPELVQHYFSNDEVLAATTPELWIKKIANCLQQPDLRSKIGRAARRKALADHCWSNRAELLMHTISANWSSEINSTFQPLTAQHYLDMYAPPVDYYMRLIRLSIRKYGHASS